MSHFSIGFTHNPPNEAENARCHLGVGFSLHVRCSFRFTVFCFFLFFSQLILMEFHQSAVMSLVVCSQITAKRLSLLVTHKQRAAFYPNCLREGTAMAER